MIRSHACKTAGDSFKRLHKPRAMDKNKVMSQTTLFLLHSTNQTIWFVSPYFRIYMGSQGSVVSSFYPGLRLVFAVIAMSLVLSAVWVCSSLILCRIDSCSLNEALQIFLSVLFKALTYASGPFPLNPSGVKYFSFTGITPHHALFVRIRSNHTSFGDIFDFH